MTVDGRGNSGHGPLGFFICNESRIYLRLIHDMIHPLHAKYPDTSTVLEYASRSHSQPRPRLGPQLPHLGRRPLCLLPTGLSSSNPAKASLNDISPPPPLSTSSSSSLPSDTTRCSGTTSRAERAITLLHPHSSAVYAYAPFSDPGVSVLSTVESQVPSVFASECFRPAAPSSGLR